MNARSSLLLQPLAALVAIACAAPLAAHAYLGQFARYAADDYCTASILGTHGLLAAQPYWYTTWSGRFSFTFAISVVELFGIGIVPILPALALLAWLAVGLCLWFPLGRKLAIPSTGLVALAGTLLVMYATLRTTPDLGQSLYWQTGMVTYLAPLLLLTAYAGWLVSRVATVPPRSPTPWSLGGAFALTLVAGGFSETYAFFQLGGLITASVVAAVLLRGEARRATVPLLAVGALGAALAAFVVAIAPGNAVRAGDYPPGNIFAAAFGSIQFSLVSIGKTVLRSPVETLLILLLPGLLGYATRDRLDSPLAPGLMLRAPEVLAIGAIVVVLAALLFSAYLPAFYSISFRPPDRALITTQYAIVMAFVLGGFLVGRIAGRLSLPTGAARTGATLAAAVALLLLLPGPALATLQTLRQSESAADYAARWDTLHQQIQTASASGERHVRVPSLPNTSNIGGFEWVQPDPDDWFNLCVARLYQVESIATTGS